MINNIMLKVNKTSEAPKFNINLLKIKKLPSRRLFVCNHLDYKTYPKYVQSPAQLVVNVPKEPKTYEVRLEMKYHEEDTAIRIYNFYYLLDDYTRFTVPSEDDKHKKLNDKELIYNQIIDWISAAWKEEDFLDKIKKENDRALDFLYSHK